MKRDIVKNGKKIKDSRTENLKCLVIVPHMTTQERENNNKLHGELKAKRDRDEEGWYSTSEEDSCTRETFSKKSVRKKHQKCIALINIQELTQDKDTELESMVASNIILCLTETQHILKINTDDNIEHKRSYTNANDRKGGGTTVIMKKDGKNMEKVNTVNADIYTSCKLQGRQTYI